MTDEVCQNCKLNPELVFLSLVVAKQWLRICGSCRNGDKKYMRLPFIRKLTLIKGKWDGTWLYCETAGRVCA